MYSGVPTDETATPRCRSPPVRRDRATLPKRARTHTHIHTHTSPPGATPSTCQTVKFRWGFLDPAYTADRTVAAAGGDDGGMPCIVGAGLRASGLWLTEGLLCHRRHHRAAEDWRSRRRILWRMCACVYYTTTRTVCMCVCVFVCACLCVCAAPHKGDAPATHIHSLIQCGAR